MHTFEGPDGQTWSATVVERTGPDYKARFVMQMTSADGAQVLTLPEVAWNSRYSAGRTLKTMSAVELRRRLRTALSRSSRADLPRV